MTNKLPEALRLAEMLETGRGWNPPMAAATLRTQHALLERAKSTLEGWANHGQWVWPESALEQAKRNNAETLAALNEHLDQK